MALLAALADLKFPYSPRTAELPEDSSITTELFDRPFPHTVLMEMFARL